MTNEMLLEKLGQEYPWLSWQIKESADVDSDASRFQSSLAQDWTVEFNVYDDGVVYAYVYNKDEDLLYEDDDDTLEDSIANLNSWVKSTLYELGKLSRQLTN